MKRLLERKIKGMKIEEVGRAFELSTSGLTIIEIARVFGRSDEYMESVFIRAERDGFEGFA